MRGIRPLISYKVEEGYTAETVKVQAAFGALDGTYELLVQRSYNYQ